MFLRSLKIENEDREIRNIRFHKGINLIVDETKPENKTESGNSVGKTTVLRLIDFCLDGDGKNIYNDPEFRTTNKTIEGFLKNNNIVVTLSLAENLENNESLDLIIRRNFLSYTKKIQEINGEKQSNEEFGQKLKEIIFKNDSEKPKLRQLISKNIRDEKNKLVNTLKVLNAFTTEAEYEVLFLFWFGVDVDTAKDKLVRDKNLEIKLQARLRKESTLSQINQSLIIINRQISDLAEKKENFNLNEKYEDDLSTLNVIKSDINRLSNTISRLEMRKELVLESKAELESDYANIDVAQIRSLYERAKALLPDIQKTFEDTLQFHNDMLGNKIKFITQELPKLDSDINENRRNLNVLLSQEKILSDKLKKSGAIEDLQQIIDELNVFFEKKGNFEEKKRLWESSNDNLNRINTHLDRINKNIESKDELIQRRIAEFNIHFADISSRLDGVHSLLSADSVDGIYKLSIANIEGNPGTGGKKSQMASFDLAYIKFADENSIPCLHFVLQDQIENVHSNQISNLLTDVVNEINCQYVLPVLRDKLPSDIDTKALEVLSLSQSNKLFKV
jgi:uncharacterized protein YydD (DUF2326 family)